MKKYCKLLALFLSFVVFLSVASVKAEPKTVTVELTIDNPVPTVNGSNTLPMEHYPFIEKGRMMLPVRFIPAVFNTKIDYDSAAKTMILYTTKIKVILVYESLIATVNGKDVSINTSYVIKQWRTFVPIRFIMETFGATVTWNPDLHKVTIVYELPEE